MILDSVGLDLSTEKAGNRRRNHAYVESILNRSITKRAQGKRDRFVKKLKRVPTIFDPEESHLSAESKYLKSPISVPRKSPTKRVYQQDQFKLFEEQDKIKSFDDIDSTLTPQWYACQKYDDHVVIYHLETKMLNVPEVTGCVRVDQNLHAKLFYKDGHLYL